MKILYLSDQDLDNNSGVSQKISMQSRAWEEAGHSVTLLSLESLSFFSADKRRLSKPKCYIKRIKWKIFAHLIVSSYKLRNILKDEEFDLVYMRYRLYAPFLKDALRSRPQIVEINTNDIHEYKHSSILLFLYNRMFRSRFLSKVDGFVCVSKELQSHVRLFNKPSIVIANGINIDLFPPKKNFQHRRPSLVFIGTANQAWHGVKKILVMANSLTEFDFHIIGTEGDDGTNIFYHGYLETHKANELLSTYDVGIGSLSLYENDMEEASPLKTRQYLAHGLPIIYAYKDTDIDGEQSFALRLPNNENNVKLSIPLIKQFVDRVHNNPDIQKEARKFSQERLDVKIKEALRITFFEKFV